MNLLSSEQIMRHTIYALGIPLICQLYFYGQGIFFNLILLIFFSYGIEYLVAYFQKIKIKKIDLSTTITSLLLCLSLPPNLPISVLFFGSFMSIFIAKSLYGGLGKNIFNPMIVGYISVLISYPAELNQWTVPTHFYHFIQSIEWLNTHSLTNIFTMATPLDQQRISDTATMTYSLHWMIFNFSAVLGGLYLIYKKIIPYQIPLGFIIALSFTYALYDFNQIDIYQHLLLGGAMLTAFFIITDPVTMPHYLFPRIVFASLVGILSVIIQQMPQYPDGIAFAVLLGNALSPLINTCYRYLSSTANSKEK